eukprot:1156406-Pelagomonas_calceolata.AAC.3
MVGEPHCKACTHMRALELVASCPAHLHAARLRLLHFDAHVDFGGVHEVLLRLDVDVVQQAARVDVVHGVVAVINVVVLPFLRAQEKGDFKCR